MSCRSSRLSPVTGKSRWRCRRSSIGSAESDGDARGSLRRRRHRRRRSGSARHHVDLRAARPVPDAASTGASATRRAGWKDRKERRHHDHAREEPEAAANTSHDEGRGDAFSLRPSFDERHLGALADQGRERHRIPVGEAHAAVRRGVPDRAGSGVPWMP